MRLTNFLSYVTTTKDGKAEPQYLRNEPQGREGCRGYKLDDGRTLWFNCLDDITAEDYAFYLSQKGKYA